MFMDRIGVIEFIVILLSVLLVFLGFCIFKVIKYYSESFTEKEDF